RAVDHDVRDPDVAVDARMLADHQRPRLAVRRGDVAGHLPVDPQAPNEHDIALDGGPRADQAVDPLLRRRRVLLVSEHGGLPTTRQGSASPGGHSPPIRRRGRSATGPGSPWAPSGRPRSFDNTRIAASGPLPTPAGPQEG